MHVERGREGSKSRYLARLKADRERRRRRAAEIDATREIAAGIEAAVLAEARRARDVLLPALRAMALRPLPADRRRRSFDWRMVADALAAGIEPAQVAEALGLAPDRFHRAMADNTRLRRYLEEARSWRRYRVECGLAELDHAGARAVASRLEQGDRRVLHLALQRIRQRAAQAPRQMAIGTRLDRKGRNSDE